jgi:cellulose biosynthesis protein BcsQ
MVTKIALFNHKGGVSKTTTTFNLGWMLAKKGKTVILVDSDPQCNLTGLALGDNSEEDEDRIEQIYSTGSNIKTGLAPAFESQPRPIEAVDCIALRQPNLYLLPGHVGFAEYEIALGIAQELSGSIQTLKNLPGAIAALLQKTSNKFQADYMLIDMSPSLGAINQNLLMISDFFLVPTNADFFSVMAINSLSKILPNWSAWAKMASQHPVLQGAVYPFPQVTLKFLGTILQNYRIRNGQETAAFKSWIEKIEKRVSEQFIPTLKSHGLLLPEHLYTEQEMDNSCTLSKISNFNSLIALSQKYGTPIYDLTQDQTDLSGTAWEDIQNNQEKFQETFSDLADKIIALSSAHAVRA